MQHNCKLVDLKTVNVNSESLFGLLFYFVQHVLMLHALPFIYTHLLCKGEVSKEGGTREGEMRECKWESTEAPPHSLSDSCVCVCVCGMGFKLFFTDTHSQELHKRWGAKPTTRQRIFFLCHKEGKRKEDTRGKDGGLFVRLVGCVCHKHVL